MKSLITALAYMVEGYSSDDDGMMSTSERQRREEKALEEKYPGINEQLELTSYGCAWHEIGFYNGFRLGVQLMAEACANPIEGRVEL